MFHCEQTKGSNEQEKYLVKQTIGLMAVFIWKFVNTNYDNNKIIAKMGCTPTKKETSSIVKQTQVIDSCLQPPEIDNETEFYSSQSSSEEVPNS